MIILHGDDQAKSRTTLKQIRDKAVVDGKEVVNLEGKNLELVNLIQVLEGGGLFGDKRLIVLEGLLSSPTSKRRDELIGYLGVNDKEEIVLWEGKTITLPTLKKINGKSQEFKISSVIFGFVESLSPRNTKSVLMNFDLALGQDPAELIFFMTTRQIRQLIQVVSDPGAFKGPSWLSGKLLKQARSFGLEKLLNMHSELYEIDRGVKTGQSNLDLRTQFELWLMKL